MTKQLLILGESHTRQFSYVTNLHPIFMGRGIEINLENIDIIKDKIVKVFETFSKSNYISFLYVGEPNCRIKLCNHWTPHWDELKRGKYIEPIVDKMYLKKCVKNLSYLSQYVDYIITPTCAYDPVIPSLIYFNELLENIFEDKLINIFKNTITDDLKVKDYYKAPNWKNDPIHLNSKIFYDFLNVLYEKNIINDMLLYTKTVNYDFGTHYLRNETNNKFGTIIID